MIVTDFRVYGNFSNIPHTNGTVDAFIHSKEISIEIVAGPDEKITQHNLHKAIAEYMEENFEKDTYAVSKKLE